MSEESTTSSSSGNSNNNNKNKNETEMERIARLAREFRENEAKRIAEEKEAEQLKAKQKKEEELRRIAAASGQFLEEAAKELENEKMMRMSAMSPTSSSSNPDFSNVSEKARLLLEKEEAERRRRLEQETNQRITPSSRVGSNTPQTKTQVTFFGTKEEENSEDLVETSENQDENPSSESESNTKSNEGNNIAEKVKSADETKTAEVPYSSSNAEDISITTPASSMQETTVSMTTPQPVTSNNVVAPTNSNSPVHDMDDHYLQALILRRRDEASGMKKRNRKAIYDGEDDDTVPQESGRKEASFEIPLEWTGNGFQVLRDAEVTMLAHIPPSRVEGCWSGTLEGKSSLTTGRGDNNNASGSITLDYKASSWSQLSLGLVRGHELFHPMITLGGSLIRDRSTVGVTFFHNASFLHAMLLEHSMYSFFFRHHFPKSKWVLSTHLSRKKELLCSLSNTKVSGHVGCNLRRPQGTVDVRFDVRPKISEDRRGHLYCQWKLGVWQFGASIVQSLHSQVATVGLGVRIISSRGLEWMVSWNRGNATMRIPIVVSRGMQNVQLIHVFYISFVSFFIQEGIADLWGWRSLPSSETEGTDGGETKPGLNQQDAKKNRENAELQRKLMERQAKRKKRDEAEKDGLVIHKAIYHLGDGNDNNNNGNTDKEEWDATIPLQFWVTNSSLILAATPKSQLLGFYDITTTSSSSSSSSSSKVNKKEQNGGPVPPRSLWKDCWNDLFDLKSQAEKANGSSKDPIPMLTVKYDFKGQSYRITVSDTEELRLPNPKAVRV